MSQDYTAFAGVERQTVDPVGAPAAAPLFTRLAAEAAGTFMIVLGILIAATFSGLYSSPWIAVALTAGLLLIAAYASFGRISGGHFNPAVTFGSALAGRTSWVDLLPYWLAQFVGAAVSAVVVWAIVPEGYAEVVGLEGKGGVIAQAANGFGEHSQLSIMAGGQVEFSLVSALLVEIIGAAVLVGVFLAVTARTTRAKRARAGAAFGLAYAGLNVIAWPVTGAGLNPARSLASALFAGESSIWIQYWLFFVAPIVGAGLAALIARAFALTPAASGVVIEEIDDTYEAVPADDEHEAHETIEASDVTDADSDQVAPPDGSTPGKPQA